MAQKSTKDQNPTDGKTGATPVQQYYVAVGSSEMKLVGANLSYVTSDRDACMSSLHLHLILFPKCRRRSWTSYWPFKPMDLSGWLFSAGTI